jgi:prevent-host-death family protein
MKLGLREANQHFSRAIRAVRAGREVILTDRGQPIAVIKPIKAAGGDEAVIESMAAEGLVEPAVRKGPTPAPRGRAVRVRGHGLSRTIIEDRDDRA